MQHSRLRSVFLTVSESVHHYLLWFLISAYVIAAAYPALGLWIRNTSFGEIGMGGEKASVSLLMIMLASLMFNAGLGVKTSHLKTIMHKKLMLIAGLAANWIVPIIYIFGVTLVMRFWYEPDEAQHILLGSALVAAMPIAGASTAWAQNSNGNMALSIGLVLCSTVVSPIVTPMAFHIFGEMAAKEYEVVLQGLAAHGSGMFLGAWVVLPCLVGLSVRLIVPEAWLAGVMPSVKLVNSIVLLLLNYSNAAVSLPQAIADHDLDFLLVTLAVTAGLCLVAFAAGDGLSRLFKVDEAERISLMYGLGMNNNGTGLVLASLALAPYPRVMVPIIFYNLIQHLVAGSVQHATRRAFTTRRCHHG